MLEKFTYSKQLVVGFKSTIFDCCTFVEDIFDEESSFFTRQDIFTCHCKPKAFVTYNKKQQKILELKLTENAAYNDIPSVFRLDWIKLF